MNSPIQHHNVEQLTQHLISHFSVAGGRALVPGLGQSHELSNREAIQSWISRKLTSRALATEVDPLAGLIERFAGELIDLFPHHSEQLAECVVLRIPEPVRDCSRGTQKGARIIHFKPRI